MGPPRGPCPLVRVGPSFDFWTLRSPNSANTILVQPELDTWQRPNLVFFSSMSTANPLSDFLIGTFCGPSEARGSTTTNKQIFFFRTCLNLCKKNFLGLFTPSVSNWPYFRSFFFYLLPAHSNHSLGFSPLLLKIVFFFFFFFPFQNASFPLFSLFPPFFVPPPTRLIEKFVVLRHLGLPCGWINDYNFFFLRYYQFLRLVFVGPHFNRPLFCLF